MNALRKAEQQVQRDQKHQLRVMNIVCFLSLHRMGMDADTIIKRFNEATAIWVECREKKVSAFQILEEEIGIEIALDGEKSYTEFDQLRWRNETLTPMQYIYSINRRKRWVFGQRFWKTMMHRTSLMRFRSTLKPIQRGLPLLRGSCT